MKTSILFFTLPFILLLVSPGIARAQTGAELQAQAEALYQNAYLQDGLAAQAAEFEKAAEKYDQAAGAYAKEGNREKAAQMRSWARAARSNADSRRKEGNAPSNQPFLASAKGTGRTTGHIADLTVVNPTGRPQVVDLGSAFIPSDGQYQPYIVPNIAPVTIPPKGTATVPVTGYCTDIRRPPVPAGAGMPSPGSWIFLGNETPAGISALTDPAQTPDGMGSEGPQPGMSGLNTVKPYTPPGDNTRTPNTANGWRPQTASGATTPTLPGTNIPLKHTINVDKYPAEAAPVLLEALNQIALKYDQLQADGLITTPFSGNPEKERESVIQQTFWLYSSALTGSDYKVEDFKANTVKQFETNTGRDFNTLKPADQQQLDQGVQQFWNTFEAVGAEAKVLETAASSDPEGWGALIEQRYQEYVAYREGGKSHEQAMKLVFANPGTRETYGDKFKERYANDKKK
ncbi:MAG: hypothetical protein IPM81_15040 [Saprospirales bacterium]|nr:hypothetical protein [Saprospirales bacterium]